VVAAIAFSVPVPGRRHQRLGWAGGPCPCLHV